MRRLGIAKAVLWHYPEEDFDMRAAIARYEERVGEPPEYIIVNPDTWVVEEELHSLILVRDNAVRLADAVLVSNLKYWDITLAN